MGMETATRACAPDSLGLKANLILAKDRGEINNGDYQEIMREAKKADTNTDGYVDAAEYSSFKCSLTSKNAIRFADKYYSGSETCTEFMIDAAQFDDNDDANFR